MKFAYADPPYIGCANYYPEKQEVDHNELLGKLMQDYDGWALSCSSPSLAQILKMDNCPDKVRIGAWVKPFVSFKRGIKPAYAWEPVLFYGTRKTGKEIPTVRDWLSCNITTEKGLVGAKPLRLCYWIFDILGMQPDDEFYDLYPGTGIFGIAWENHKQKLLFRQTKMPI